jgi:hypothetical protein
MSITDLATQILSLPRFATPLDEEIPLPDLTFCHAGNCADSAFISGRGANLSGAPPPILISSPDSSSPDRIKRDFG